MSSLLVISFSLFIRVTVLLMLHTLGIFNMFLNKPIMCFAKMYPDEFSHLSNFFVIFMHGHRYFNFLGVWLMCYVDTALFSAPNNLDLLQP